MLDFFLVMPGPTGNNEHRFVQLCEPMSLSIFITFQKLNRFWKVMKIDNAIFQNLESFGKGKCFHLDYRKALDFHLEKFQNSLKWIV